MRWLTQRMPTVDGDLLFSFSSSGEIVLSGQFRWQENLAAKLHERFLEVPGPFGDFVIILWSRVIGSFARHSRHHGVCRRPQQAHRSRHSADQIRDPLPHHAGDAPVVVSEACGVRQYVVFSMGGLSGFAASDGRKLWDHPRPKTCIAGATPCLSSGTPSTHPAAICVDWSAFNC